MGQVWAGVVGKFPSGRNPVGDSGGSVPKRVSSGPSSTHVLFYILVPGISATCRGCGDNASLPILVNAKLIFRRSWL